MGAEPLYFLDYYATGKLNVDVAEIIMKGIVEGCRLANIALIGGETAEMPGMYHNDDYDLAGFTVGIIEKDQICDGHTIQPGDCLIALPSSGPHANGYSLIRRIVDHAHAAADVMINDKTLADHLLTPTRIYVKSMLPLAKAGLMKGAAHITGGAFTDKLPRIIPQHCTAQINVSTWTLPPIFQWLQAQGNISNAEMRRAFNCGVGMVICVAPAHRDQAIQLLREHGEMPFEIGTIIARDTSQRVVIFTDDE
jgi:phosphoribosylformylglycinamidine cyclo-ligase